MPTPQTTIPATRRVARLQPDGGAHRFAIVEEPVPSLAPNEILIRIEAASLNYRDLLVQRGHLGAVQPGLIPLSDGAGTVIAIGRDTTRWKTGDRVAPIFYQDWRVGAYREAYGPSGLGAGATNGVLADLIAVHEDALVALPPMLDTTEGATLPCAALTAWHALVFRGAIKADDTLLVQGTGGVALFGLQIANAIGARVIVLSSSDDKRERATALGAFATVNYQTTPDWDAEVRRLTDGLGASHILELGGPDTFDRSLRSLRGGGHIAQIGVFTGFGPQSNLMRLQGINGTIDGINVGSREHFEAMNLFFAEHDIRPIIDKTFALSDVHLAYDEMANGRHFGKLVIRL